MESLGSYLKKMREIKGFTLREVEESTDISNSYISQIEQGKVKKPSPSKLWKLSELYGVAYDELMVIAGHIVSTPKNWSPPTHVFQELTEDEEEQMTDFLHFLRHRKKGKTK